MEANFFRFLAQELGTALTGRRIEKVHGPARDVLCFTLGAAGGKTHLLFRPARSAGLVFATSTPPQNPLVPPALVMWLRKRLVGRRLLGFQTDWPALRLAFALTPRDIPQAGQMLVFDLRQGLTLEEDFHPAPEPPWPDAASAQKSPDIWKLCPQLTPPLRRHLAELGPEKAEDLLTRLRLGESEGFFLSESSPLVWPPLMTGDLSKAECFATASEAAAAFGGRTLFPQMDQAENRQAQRQAEDSRKRLHRRQALLARDAERLQELVEQGIAAEALQANLYQLRDTPSGPLTLEHPTRGQVRVPLDPQLTPAQNMARLFARAAKGRRGLEHVQRRSQELEAMGEHVLPSRTGTATNSKAALVPSRYKGLAVALFRTTDGFLLLRGKSSAANHAMLSKAAGPYDLWFHAAGGPSAHLILKRDFPDQEVPELSLREAAILTALKSFRKDDAKADVLCAKVKDVRKIKGAALGSVAVDEVERTLRVELDATLETKLALRAVDTASDRSK